MTVALVAVAFNARFAGVVELVAVVDDFCTLYFSRNHQGTWLARSDSAGRADQRAG